MSSNGDNIGSDSGNAIIESDSMQSYSESLQSEVATVTPTLEKLSVDDKVANKLSVCSGVANERGNVEKLSSETEILGGEASEPLTSNDSGTKTGGKIIAQPLGEDDVKEEGKEKGDKGRGEEGKTHSYATNPTNQKARRTILVLHEDIISDAFWEKHPHIIARE